MKLTDLKRTKAERKKDMSTKCVPYGGDDYGYGTRLRLEDGDLEKLGIELPEVGEEFTVECIAAVVSVAQNASSTHKHRSLELQIKKIGLQKNKGKISDAIEKGMRKANED